MNRTHVARAALAALLALTGLTAWASETGAALPLAALSLAKVAVVGVVFLELDHAHPVYRVAAAVVVSAVLLGAIYALTPST